MGEKWFPGVIAWAHSNLLTFLAETGLLGAFAFCLLFVTYFRELTRIVRSLPPGHPWLRAFGQGSLAAVGCFLAVGIFHDNFFDGEVIFALWFTLAASLRIRRLVPQEGEGVA